MIGDVKPVIHEPLKWHTHYCDPTGDTVFRSHDGIWYRFAGFRLPAVTTYFQNHEPEAHGGLPPHFKIDLPSNLLDRFLVYVDSPPTSPNRVQSLLVHLEWTEVFQFYRFGLHHKCAAFLEPIERYLLLKDHLENNTVAFLQYAAGDSNLSLFRKILEGTINNKQITDYGFWKFHRSLPDHWKDPFLKAILEDDDKKIAEGNIILRKGMRLAHSFNPPQISNGNNKHNIDSKEVPAKKAKQQKC